MSETNDIYQRRDECIKKVIGAGFPTFVKKVDQMHQAISAKKLDRPPSDEEICAIVKQRASETVGRWFDALEHNHKGLVMQDHLAHFAAPCYRHIEGYLGHDGPQKNYTEELMLELLDITMTNIDLLERHFNELLKDNRVGTIMLVNDFQPVYDQDGFFVNKDNSRPAFGMCWSFKQCS